MERNMAKKLSITVIAATVAASLAITPAAEAGGRGLALGVGLGVLAVGAMAHQAQQAKQAKMARARAQAQAQARAKAQAQAKAKAQARAQAQAAAAKRQQQLAAAQKAKAAAAADVEQEDEVAEKTTKSGPSTYVAAPSSTAALTQVDVDQANAANGSTPVDTASVAVADSAPAETPSATDEEEEQTCKRFVPALGVAVDVDCP
ncbi:hypothetical protein [Hyphomicrobium sp.]|uniref:hypothetical protein n=1 Tax=Hyphomicrobium sp. TaxID=82 RepID=UPI0025C13E86|nr:hypothetical protein [Hyphomicrobium sp.]MCC7254169.1 hypothetical protein [Hyphomicrobium sp.]